MFFLVVAVYLLLVVSMAMPMLLPMSLTATLLAVASQRRRWRRARAEEAARLVDERQQLAEQRLGEVVRYFGAGR